MILVCSPPPCCPGSTHPPPRRPPGSLSPSPTWPRWSLRKRPGDKDERIPHIVCVNSLVGWATCGGEYIRGQLRWLSQWLREHYRDHLQHGRGPLLSALSIPWEIQGKINENELKENKRKGYKMNLQSREDGLDGSPLNNIHKYYFGFSK